MAFSVLHLDSLLSVGSSVLNYNDLRQIQYLQNHNTVESGIFILANVLE
jgi:hypothetical protein